MRTPPIAKGGFLLSEHDDPNPADPLDRAMPDMTAPGRDPLAGSPTGGAADVSRHPAAIRHQRSHLQSARGPFCHGLPGAAQDELSARCDQPRSASHAGSWCGPVLSFQPEQARGPAPGQTVSFGIQPEHCHPVRDRRAKRRGGKPGLVTIRVALVGPTGPETIPVATLAGQEVTISCKPDDRPQVGMDCALAIDRTKRRLFDPASGSRLWCRVHGAPDGYLSDLRTDKDQSRCVHLLRCRQAGGGCSGTAPLCPLSSPGRACLVPEGFRQRQAWFRQHSPV